MDSLKPPETKMTHTLFLNFRDGQKYVLSIGENDIFRAKITLTNTGEPAYQPSFYLVVPAAMQYAGSIPIYPVSRSIPIYPVSRSIPIIQEVEVFPFIQ